MYDLYRNLPEGLTNYAIRLLARQQLLHRIHHRQEHTVKYGMVMQICNPLSQQEEKVIDDTLEIVPENNNTIERIISGVNSVYSSE